MHRSPARTSLISCALVLSAAGALVGLVAGASPASPAPAAPFPVPLQALVVALVAGLLLRVLAGLGPVAAAGSAASGPRSHGGSARPAPARRFR